MIILRDGQVVQSVQFKHTNVIHYDAVHAIETFNRWSVDEIVFLNVSRTPDGQQQFLDIVEQVSEHCFVPLAAGGWITNEDYGAQLVARGADKLVVNSAIKRQPELVKQLITRFGSQCVVASIDYKSTDQGEQVVIDRGAEPIGMHPVTWAQYAEQLGCGEIFLNSVDHDGNRKGYNLQELNNVANAVSIPVIAFGGVFRWQHLLDGIVHGADAVAAANIFHYTEHATKRAKRYLADRGIPVRQEGTL